MINQAKKHVLANLKEQWKIPVKQQYQTEPGKVKNANIEKNANDIITNPMVSLIANKIGITIEDIKRVLAEIRDEVAMEGK